MDFTREPVIQTVITPREGFRLVVRSSKTQGLEEHFVDAVEVVCFGSATFFRSIERPKPFIVPASDYEVLEVRESRVVLKTPVAASQKQGDRQRSRSESRGESRQEPRHDADRSRPADKEEEDAVRERQPQTAAQDMKQDAKQEGRQEARQEGKQEGKDSTKPDRRKDRRRGFRRRRGRDDETEAEAQSEAGKESGAQSMQDVMQDEQFQSEADETGAIPSTAPMLSSILPPPTTLIRDDLERLRGSYREAFYDTEFSDSMGDDGSDDEGSDFSQETFEREISMKEGGDAEVPQQDPFREEGIFHEDAANVQKSDD